jgi:hypothetical protein
MTSEQIKQLLNAAFKPKLLEVIVLLMPVMLAQKAVAVTIMSRLSRRLSKENRWSNGTN